MWRRAGSDMSRSRRSVVFGLTFLMGAGHACPSRATRIPWPDTIGLRPLKLVLPSDTWKVGQPLHGTIHLEHEPTIFDYSIDGGGERRFTGRPPTVTGKIMIFITDEHFNHESSKDITVAAFIIRTGFKPLIEAASC